MKATTTLAALRRTLAARRPLIVALALSTLAACSAAAPRERSLPADLLSGAALFGAQVSSRPIAPSEIFALDEEMRAFVARETAEAKDPGVRLRRLLRAMQRRGLFSLAYEGNATLTVRRTFHERRGNCLSFTMLFVALAREAGLDVAFQMVEIPPVWSSDSGLVSLSNHINALVRTASRPEYVVDFNEIEFKGNYERRVVGDDYALALFYSNLGVEALARGEDEQSFVHFREAVEIYPEIAGPWVNLGILYARHERFDQAESAYLQALTTDESNRSALTNLVRLYVTIGDAQSAETYRKRVERYQAQNPYYHYQLAEAAYRQGRPADALLLLDRAIRLKEDEHQFFFLQARAHYELGQTAEAEESFALARRHARDDDVKARYSAKLAALTADASSHRERASR